MCKNRKLAKVKEAKRELIYLLSEQVLVQNKTKLSSKTSFHKTILHGPLLVLNCQVKKHNVMSS